MKSLLRGHQIQRQTSLERPLVNVNSNKKTLGSIPSKGPPLLKGHGLPSYDKDFAM